MDTGRPLNLDDEVIRVRSRDEPMTQISIAESVCYQRPSVQNGESLYNSAGGKSDKECQARWYSLRGSLYGILVS